MAFAAVNSLTRILEQMLQHQHVILPNRQRVESLLKEVSLFEDILENSSTKSSKKIKSFESQIIIAAKRGKDLIESRIRYQLTGTSPLCGNVLSKSAMSDYNLIFSSHCLKKLKREIDFIKQRVMKIEEEIGVQECTPASDSSRPAASSCKITMVGLEDDFMEIKTRLVRESLALQTVCVVGMGGIGKTTIAREVYNDSFILFRFDTRAWVTISQSYDVRQIIIGLLDSMEKLTEEIGKEITERLSEHLYKNLKGRRYLIVMDDVWNTKVWDDLRKLFPNDNNASRILLTTRLKNVGVYVNSSPPLHDMHFLNEDGSWKLFRQKVFGEYSCPLELEEIGKKIARNCGGLPLAIVVIGGLLSKATKTQHYWRNVAENLTSVIISNDEQCSKTIALSYNHLPHHLKDCFLYTGIFPEDFDISVSKLVKLWVAEGFINQMGSKSLEDVAYGYLLDLVDRSLILVGEQSSVGKIKTCKIHDIVRDFCIREAKKEMFLGITDKSLHDIPVGTSLCRLSVYPNTTNIFPCDDKKLSSLQVSSLFSFDRHFNHSVQHLNPRPLRVLNMVRTLGIGIQGELNESLFYNLHYLACDCDHKWFSISSSSMLPNLQTLILYSFHPPIEVAIWNMPQLRHVQVEALFLSDPLEGGNSVIVLENLRTLSLVRNFRCSDEVLKRIPNLKKLGISYVLEPPDWQYYCLNNLVRLHKLEALKCRLRVPSPCLLHHLTFPPTIKKLSLSGLCLPWKDMKIVGLLTNLEVLKLEHYAFEGQEWEPAEGEFLKLKHLLLEDLNLENWRADSIHFPSLQCLIIRYCRNLKEMPCGIGEILMLQLIELHCCADSLVASVKQMQEEQLGLGNDGLQVRIRLQTY